MRRNPSFDREDIPPGMIESGTANKRVLRKSGSREIDSGDELPERSGHSRGPMDTSSHHNRTSGGGGSSSHTSKALPGRPRRRQGDRVSGRKSRKKTLWFRFYKRWIQGFLCSFSSLFGAVVLWYSLGVVSIGTSKLLLMKGDHTLAGVPPLFLTLQQLIIGSTLLRFLLHIRFLGSSGLQPWPIAAGTSTDASTRQRYNFLGQADTGLPGRRRPTGLQAAVLKALPASLQPNLLLAGVYFCFGFLATNYGFSGSSAAFVETIKAAEPITSATIAVSWGLEVLSRPETASLSVIVAGVVLSTVGNNGQTGDAAVAAATVSESITACCVVMAANLCFSFRGLYQKLFRAAPEGSSAVLDDINLQFRMQQIGIGVLLTPAIFLESTTILRVLYAMVVRAGSQPGGWMAEVAVAWQYLSLALVNGCAFAGYNLASTFILSRISVVHHAALNCLRRIFAIIVTSIAFAIPMTLTGAFGILVSVSGFMSFTHYKIRRQRQPKPLSSLLPVSAVTNGKGYV